MQNRQYQFCTGPVMVSETMREALLRLDMCHRVPSFENVIRNAQENLLMIYNANVEYTILLITGSGTTANETVISSCFCAEDKVLLVSNGEFGGRLQKLLQIHEVKADILSYEWGQLPEVAEVEEKLRNNPRITTVTMVFLIISYFSFHLISTPEFVLIFIIFFVSIVLSFPGFLMKLLCALSQTECAE